MESFTDHRSGTHRGRCTETSRTSRTTNSGVTLRPGRRTAHLHRRNDPTAFLVGDHAGWIGRHSNSPTDQIDAAGEPLATSTTTTCGSPVAAARWLPSTRATSTVTTHPRHAGTGSSSPSSADWPPPRRDHVYIPRGRRSAGSTTAASSSSRWSRSSGYPEAGCGTVLPFDVTRPSRWPGVPRPRPRGVRGPLPQRRARPRSSTVYRPPRGKAGGATTSPSPSHQDYDVITSETVHSAATVHLFMQATGVYVMNSPAAAGRGPPGHQRLPGHHRNTDFDEIAFYHGGSVFASTCRRGWTPMRHRQ